MNKDEAIKWLRAKSHQEFCKEPCEIAIKALEELNLYEQNELCLIPSNVYERQCEELDRLKEKEKLDSSDYVSDSLLIGVDFSLNDEKVVVVMRYTNNNKMHVINMIRNEEARELYDILIGNKKKSMKHGHWKLLDECSNAGVYCSVCNKKVYKEHYANIKVKSKFCPNCGAVMDEEFERL